MTPAIPTLLGLGWRIEQLATGLFWHPPSESFTSEARFWDCGGPIDPDTGESAFSWASMPGVFRSASWVTAVPNSRQLDLALFPDGEYSVQVELKARRTLGPIRTATAQASFSIDSREPVVTIESPVAGGVAAIPVARIRGSVRDPGDNLLGLRIAVQDRVSGLWWDPAGWWRDRRVSIEVPVQGESWSYRFLGGAFGSGSYLLEVAAWDAAANLSEQTRTFLADFGPPAVDVLAPQPGSQGQAASVEFLGFVRNRNHGSVRLEVVVEDLERGTRWDAAQNDWSTTASPAEASIDDSLSWRSAWSFSFDVLQAAALGGSGSYQASFTPRIARLFPRSRGETVVVPFSTIPVGDTIRPDTVIVRPLSSDTLPQGIVEIEGTASDNFAPVEVRVTVARSTGNSSVPYEYWNGAIQAFTPTRVENQALLEADGTWIWSWDATGYPGAYNVSAAAYDGTGNRDQSPSGIALFIA
ncbi:hypothetical protein [Cyanobium sp. NIES-981]|uniref:hypothetical protein n=1 Tax=Cyanobium sp. NIES-981 TaxID=1851505 RepID=UPI0012FC1593|nr:hypothetical protein [Cyanobium sp. NIES-981]